jgi:hypothetical protein
MEEKVTADGPLASYRRERVIANDSLAPSDGERARERGISHL